MVLLDIYIWRKGGTGKCIVANALVGNICWTELVCLLEF